MSTFYCAVCGGRDATTCGSCARCGVAPGSRSFPVAAGRPPVTETLVKTIEIHNVTVDGYDAQYWRDSYVMLRDAIMEHLGDHVHDDDVAEEAILIKAIEQSGVDAARWAALARHSSVCSIGPFGPWYISSEPIDAPTMPETDDIGSAYAVADAVNKSASTSTGATNE